MQLLKYPKPNFEARTMEALVCNLCKEPAWNFMCMECVASDVRNILPRGLGKKFMAFHREFASHFSAAHLVLNGAVYCFNCKSTQESPVCPACYAKEVHHWLEEDSPSLAKKLMMMLSFGGQPLAEGDERPRDEEAGICDECGEYADDLVLSDGQWVCKECTLGDEE